MDYWEFQHRVVVRIDALLDARATYRGAKKELAAQAGVSADFFKVLRRHSQRMPMDKVFRVIEVLGESPIRVLYEAARDLDGRLGEFPPLRQTVDDLPADSEARQVLEDFERLRGAED